MEEYWKDIIGYERYYQVSNLGNVRSLDRKITWKNSFRNISGFYWQFAVPVEDGE